MKVKRKQIQSENPKIRKWIKTETEVNLFLAGFSHLQSLCSWLVPNEFYSMLGRTGHQLIQIVFLHRGNCMLFYFWRGENEKTAFAPLFFLSLHHLPVSSQQSLYRSPLERQFDGKENVIWAGFGPIGNMYWKKKLSWLQATFEDVFFMFSGAIFYFFENVVGSALISCIIAIWDFSWKNRSQIGLSSH